jgi:hypothetical protein
MWDIVWKITKAKNGWGHSLSGRALVYQVQDPEFKLWYHLKKKEKGIETKDCCVNILVEITKHCYLMYVFSQLIQ